MAYAETIRSIAIMVPFDNEADVVYSVLQDEDQEKRLQNGGKEYDPEVST